MNLASFLGEICLCPICFISYDGSDGTPVVAACGHTLCRVCSIALSADSACSFKCPVCEKISEKPLSPNIELMNLLDILQFDVIFSPDNNAKWTTASYFHSEALITAVKRRILFECNVYSVYSVARHQEAAILLSLHKSCLRYSFHKHIEWLKTTRHPHVVLMTGYINEGDDCAIAFEPFLHLSLQQCLFDSSSNASPHLNATKRTSIAIDVAKGVIYLQRKLHAAKNELGVSDVQIADLLSRLLSTTHILLDATLTAKILPACLSVDGSLLDTANTSNYIARSSLSEEGEEDDETDAVVSAILCNCVTRVALAEELAEAEKHSRADEQVQSVSDPALATHCILRSYGLLVLVLVLNITVKKVHALFEEMADTGDGGVSVDDMAKTIISKMSFVDSNNTRSMNPPMSDGDESKSALGVDGGSAVASRPYGVDCEDRPLWDGNMARNLVHLALMCMSDTCLHRPKNMVYVLARLMRIRHQMMGTLSTILCYAISMY
jgi:hypothetical protein